MDKLIVSDEQMHDNVVENGFSINPLCTIGVGICCGRFGFLFKLSTSVYSKKPNRRGEKINVKTIHAST